MPGSRRTAQGRRQGIDVRPEAVRQARLDAGLSLGRLAGNEITRAAIHLVETGKMRPSMKTLQLIAQRTGRPVAYFLPSWEASNEQLSVRDQLRRLVEHEEFGAAIELAHQILDGPLPPGIDAEVRLLLGSSYVRRHEGSQALDHLGRARTFFEETDDALMTVEAMDWEATALFLVEDPDALAKSADALQRCEQLRPPRPGLQVRILIHLAAITYRRGEWQSTVKLYERGLELSKIEPNIRHKAMMHDGLSSAYQQLGRFPAAVDQARRAFTLYSMDRDERSLARIETNLGYLLLQAGELDAADVHLKRALELCEERGLERWGRSFVVCSLAELHIARGELEQAESRLHETLEVAKAHHERRQQAMAWRLFGRLYLQRGDNASADRAFANAFAIFSDLKLPERLRECHIEYAEALQARGLLELSIVHWRAAAEVGRQVASSSAATASLLGELGA